MKLRRVIVAASAVTAAALALAGCSTAAPKSEIVEKTSLSIAQNSPVTSLNQLVANQYSTYNADLAALTNTGFTYYDNTPKLVDNTAFGTYKEVSKSPLTIQYNINKGVTWSDGDQVNAADILLEWASSITKYNNPKGKVNFGSINAGSGLDNIVKTPTVSNDDLTVTTVFAKPYVDWQQSLLSPDLPAHIVYQEAYPTKNATNAEADAAVIKAIQTNNQTVLAALAKVWTNNWNVASMPADKKLLVDDGAYVVSDFVKNQYVTLQKRSDYTGGPVPNVDTVTIRFISDPTAQVQALANGEVNIISGQATTDTLDALKKLKNVKVSNTEESTYEHVDLTFNRSGGPFNPATYGGGAVGAQKALEVRQAFLETVPRQEIVSKLIKPLNPSATLDNSQMFLPGSAGYSESVASNGSSAYANVNIAGAKALLAKAGVSNPTVIFSYPNDNPRRVSEFQLIKASAALAGFNVKDAGTPGATFFQNLGNGKYDASIFAWQYTSLAYTGNQAAFQTGGAANYQGYSNAASDALWQKLETSTGTAAQNNALLAGIDKNAWADAVGVTLFQFPDVTAWSDNIENVSDNALSPTVFWNYFQWKVDNKTPAS